MVACALPPRVEASIQYLYLCDTLRTQSHVFDGVRTDPRDLTDQEAEVESAALGVLKSFFRERDGDDAKSRSDLSPCR